MLFLCPRNIRKKRGERLGKFKNEVSVWRAGTICHILSDQRYTGDAIFGKTISKKIKYVKEHGNGEVHSLQELHSKIKDKE